MVPANGSGAVKCRECGKPCESSWYNLCWSCSERLNECQMRWCYEPHHDEDRAAT